MCLFLATIISCKNDKETKTKEVKEEKKEVISEIESISEASIPLVSRWTKNNMTIVESEQDDDFNAIILSRTDASKPAFTSFENVQIYNGSTYKISVLVKGAEKQSAFGMRVQSKYPNRVDAVFDLDSGKVIDVKHLGKGLADNVKAEIEHKTGDWYLCTITADLFEDSIRVIFGPTNSSLKPEIWEAKTGENNSVYLAPSSFKILEF